MNHSCVSGTDPVMNVPNHLLLQTFTLHDKLYTWFSAKRDYVDWYKHLERVIGIQNRGYQD